MQPVNKPILIYLLLLCAVSCPPVPGADDILRIDDRLAPVITLDAAPSLEYNTQLVEIAGRVCDTQPGVQPAANIESFNYYFEEDAKGYTVYYNSNGNFLVAVDTLCLPQETRVVFEAVDKAGNKGQTGITLLNSAVSATPQPDPPAYRTGAVWFEPEELTVANNSPFGLEIHLNSGIQRFAAYSINISYSPLLLCIDTAAAYNGVKAGADGFISVININTAGMIIVTGFDNIGKGPGYDLHILTLYFYAIKAGIMPVSLKVNILTDEQSHSIGTLRGYSCKVYSFE